ncbi:hypothetical protein ACS0TY_014706 [Phlomoides rotata]
MKPRENSLRRRLFEEFKQRLNLEREPGREGENEQENGGWGNTQDVEEVRASLEKVSVQNKNSKGWGTYGAHKEGEDGGPSIFKPPDESPTPTSRLWISNNPPTPFINQPQLPH